MAFTRYLMQWVDDRKRAGEVCPFTPRELDSAVFRLARTVKVAIDEMIPGPSAVMRWSKEAIKVVSESGNPLRWESEVGFVCVQAYPETTSRVVKTRLGDNVMQLQLRCNGTKLDPRRQATAFMPNVIHSFDAAHEQMTICGMLDRGVEDMYFNHDEYSALPCDADVLRSVTLEKFVEMYQKDQLKILWAQLQAQSSKSVPDPPPRGNLDIQSVLQSQYCFG